MAGGKNMEIIILKIIACICASMVAGIMALKDEIEYAFLQNC